MGGEALEVGRAAAVVDVAAVGLGAAFVWYALRVLRDATDGKAAIGLFRYSISYLSLLFLAIAVDALPR